MPKKLTAANKILYWYAVSPGDAALFFQTSNTTLNKWRLAGAPFKDGYSLPELHKWLIEREHAKSSTGENLKKEKTRAEIDRILASIEKMKERTIPKEQHETEMKTMALEFKAFIESAISKNYQEFVGLQSGEEAHAVLRGLWSATLKKWGYCKEGELKERKARDGKGKTKTIGAGESTGAGQGAAETIAETV